MLQVITAGKPFQGNQLAPHMLTTAQGKQVLQANQSGNANNITQGIGKYYFCKGLISSSAG